MDDTLAAFLLARITDTETAARESLDTGYQPPPHSPDDHPEYIPDFYEPPTRQHRAEVARILVECEAKRRMVALWERWEKADGHEPDYWSAPVDHMAALLALPYADHPDYDARWLEQHQPLPRSDPR